MAPRSDRKACVCSSLLSGGGQVANGRVVLLLTVMLPPDQAARAMPSKPLEPSHLWGGGGRADQTLGRSMVKTQPVPGSSRT